MRKRILGLILVLLFILTGCSSSITASSTVVKIPTLERDILIYDEDYIISDDLEEQFNNTLVKLRDETGISCYILTVPNLSETSTTTKSYYELFLSSLTSFNTDENNSITILLSRDKKTLEVKVGKTLKRFIAEETLNSLITNQCNSYLEDGQYTQIVENSINVVLVELNEFYDLSTLGLNLSGNN